MLKMGDEPFGVRTLGINEHVRRELEICLFIHSNIMNTYYNMSTINRSNI